MVLADDHAIVRDGLRHILAAQSDISVVADVANGREAVKEARELHPDVVVMDVAMPLLNGIDATALIREASPSTEVVVLSMHATSEHISLALRAGANGYLLKQCSGKEVVNAVRAVHGGRRYLSHAIAEMVVEGFLRLSEAGPRSPLESLSSRERQVLQLVVDGESSVAIGDQLCLSPKTVETYRSRIMQKLGVDSLPALVKFALQNGLTSETLPPNREQDP